MKHYLLRALLLIVIAGTSTADAVTLGQARVNSFLGEPLDAEIDLIGLAAGQHQDLRLRIANDEHFARLGIAHDPLLRTLNFDVVQSGSRWLVRAHSTRPVSEPFVDFPLLLSWPGGQFVKQYTLLLDPPRRVQPARVARASRPVSSTKPIAASVTDDGAIYGPVQPGEGLLAIAQRLHPAGITTRQMAMALLSANPQAFIDGDMDKLRAGAVLTVPQLAVIEQLDATSANAEFATEARRRQVPVATSPRTPDEVAAAEPPAKPEAAAPEAEATAADPGAADDGIVHLHIVSETEPTSAGRDSRQVVQEQLLMALEELESNRIMTDAIQTSLVRLESELKRMQRLLELKDAQIAALKSETETSDTTQEVMPTVQPAIPEAASAGQPVAAEPVSEAAEPAAETVEPTSETAAATEPTAAPVAVASIEPPPVAAAASPVRPWYEQYLWVTWVILGVMGLVALLMLIRRPQPATEDVRIADLPGISTASRDAHAMQVEPSPEGLEEAAEDFRKLAAEQLAEPAPANDAQADLPELEVPATAQLEDEEGQIEIEVSLPDETEDESKLLATHPEPVADGEESVFSDDDIASWVAELEPDSEQIDAASANDDEVLLVDDIPSILTELDDQLTSPVELTDIPEDATIQLDTGDEMTEDDAFGMSLDLARAYLEIGDQDGAKDMLEQALSGARDPGHRRQIEELLQQIG